MDSRVPHFSYLGDEIILSQFSLLAENIQKAIGGNANANDGILSMSKQIQNISRHAKSGRQNFCKLLNNAKFQ